MIPGLLDGAGSCSMLPRSKMELLVPANCIRDEESQSR